MPTLSSPRAITFALDCPVSYKILRNAPATLSGSMGAGWEATLDFQVDSPDLYKFCQFAAGDKYTVTVGGGTVDRYIPVSHPDLPKLICTGVKAVGKGGYFDAPGSPPAGYVYPTAFQNHDLAFVSLTFTNQPYAVDGSTPFLRLETRGSSDRITLAGSRVKFPSDSLPIQADAGVDVGTVTYACTIDLATVLNDAVLNPLMGHVNNATFLGFGAGKIRFDTYQSSLSTSATLQQAYTRTLFLSYREIPWNQFLRPDYTWEAPTSPSGAFMYTASDLSPLIA